MFLSLKRKIKFQKLRNVVIGLVIAIINITFVFFYGFSFEFSWRIGPIASDYVIPIPSVFVTGVFLIVGLFFFIFFISSIKDFIKNTTYEKIIESIKDVGDFDFINQSLSATSSSDLVRKGDLRYNEDFFCYIKGTEVFLVSTKNIVAIEPITTHKKKVEHFLRIKTCSKNVIIPTNEANLVSLSADVSSVVKSALLQK